MDRTTRQELEDLLSALVDGAIGAAQQQRLGELLQQHAEAREMYLAYFDLHTELSLTGGLVDLSHVGPNAPAALPPGLPAGNSGGSAWWPAAAFTFLIVLLIAGWLVWRPRPASSASTLADLMETDNAHWDEGSAAISKDGRIPAGQLRLKQGEARLRMRSGVELVCQAPLNLELLDPKAVRLLRGNLSMKVSEEGIGFRVITPTTDLVDMGTEFGVAVEESGATEVHVSQGVVVARSNAGSGVVPILSGEAGRVDVPRDRHDMSHGDFVSIGFDPSRFRGLSPMTVAAGRDDSRAAGDRAERIPPGARVVFLGDRATSRETHLLLINQALADLPDAVAPRLFNAGVAFRLLFEEPEFLEQVAVLRPTHAVLEFGPEIAAYREPWGPWSVEKFRQAITRLADRLEQARIEPIIVTGFVVSNEQRAAEGLLRQYNEVLRELARSRKLRLADVDRLVRQSGSASRLTGAYDIPTFEGFRMMAAGVLEAMGYPNAHVPEALQLGLLPGVLTEWKSRLKLSADSLDTQRALTLEPGQDWTTLIVPQQDELSERLPVPSQSFLWQDRVRGYVFHKNWGTANHMEAIAYVDSPTQREAFLNTGGNLKTVWLNGRRFFDRGQDWTGWHPGKERIPVRLLAGRNKIVVEAENLFFVSLTDARDWALPRPAVGKASAGESP